MRHRHEAHQVKIYKRSAQDHKNKAGCAKRVEYDAAAQDHRILKPFISEIIKEKKQGKKIKYKRYAAKYHFVVEKLMVNV